MGQVVFYLICIALHNSLKVMKHLEAIRKLLRIFSSQFLKSLLPPYYFGVVTGKKVLQRNSLSLIYKHIHFLFATLSCHMIYLPKFCPSVRLGVIKHNELCRTQR